MKFSKYFSFILFCLSCSFSLNAREEEALKQRIQNNLSQLETSLKNKEKSEVYYDLALAYLEDQQIDRAFTCFLDALEHCPAQKLKQQPLDEKKVFEEAYSYYLKNVSLEPVETAEYLVEHYKGLADQHGDYLHLHLLLATAYANLNQYETFFTSFYRSYPYFKEDYLCQKTKGIISLRLAQKEVLFEQRREWIEKAINYLQLALKSEKRDASIYRILISIAIEDKQEERLYALLQKMIDDKVSFSRGDIYFYVREAIALEDFELAQELIDHAKELYQVSRAITAAQEYLNQQRNSLEVSKKGES